MIVAVLKETVPGERRVALVPAVVKRLVDAGFQVVVESGAGERAGFPDTAYLNHAGRLAESREALFAETKVLLQVRSDSMADVADLERLRPGQTLIALCNPLGNPGYIQTMANRGVTIFALELLPRIPRAQSMDVVNPLVRTDPTSPIAGMPILDVDKARTVVVIKRSLSPGFAGIPSPLFVADNTLMFFGDGKKAIEEITAVKSET